MILPLNSDLATLEAAGGKGLNLARLARAGYSVPPGFLITTGAYHAFLEANQLAKRILARVASLQADDPAALVAASAEIRAWFNAGAIPADLAAELRAAYVDLGQPAVAVRSSATAEDLPDLSFAGQQDTYLNVRGESALLAAIVKCWGSLWTARAIGYRARNRIGAEGLALAVVVQAMVQSEASGVLFTANPLTGLRGEMVIDAAFGLGEALVSGQVEPDHYVVETGTLSILSKTLGAKALSIRSQAEGGVRQVAEDARERQALPDEQIVALAQLCQRVAADFGFPQDIEWAWAEGQLYLLQTRPITSLYPIPAGLPPGSLRVLFSFGAVQGMLEPMTPLGRDAICCVIASAGHLLGYDLTCESQRLVYPAGERMWMDITPVIRNGLGRRVARVALEMVEPGARRAMEMIWDDARLKPLGHGPSAGVAWHLLSFVIPMAGRVLRFLADPARGRAEVIAQLDLFYESFAARNAVAGEPRLKLAQRASNFRVLNNAFPRVLPTVGSGLVAGMASFGLLRNFAGHLPRPAAGGDPAQWVLELTRGVPYNVTTEMDLALWQVARAMQADTHAAGVMRGTPAAQLAEAYLAGGLPPAAQAAIADFLARYGFRGIGEIDLGRQRWREDPTPVMQALQSYLQIEEGEQAPDAVFERGAQAAARALDRLEAAARATWLGWLKARLVRWLGGRMRASIGLRESPKFNVIKLMGVIREGLLDSGRNLVAAGDLDQPDDIFFLHLMELEAFGGGAWGTGEMKARVAARRASHERERLRGQVPRLLLSDGRAFYEGLGGGEAGAAEGAITGSPVSPGVVEGTVRVVFDPHQAQLAPGEILVCRGTDPAWTPLFLAAGGLVMEVGGMMTHGSVVAREYGIPAVVGVDRATQRLQTGQRIRVDGSTGRIVSLD